MGWIGIASLSPIHEHPPEADDRGFIGLRPNDPGHPHMAALFILDFRLKIAD